MANKKTKSSKSKKNKVQGITPSGIDSTKQENKKPISEKTQRKGSYMSKLIRPGSWKTNAAIFFLLVIATILLYNSDLHLGFFSVDDEYYVEKDIWIKKINFENLSHIFTTLNYSNYSPFHLLSYMLDYAVAGLNPYAFHLSSNIWAGIVAGFVYLIALAFTRRNVVAIAAALLFIVNPAHVEAISWISSRKDLVATAFALPSLLAYLQYRKRGKFFTYWYIAAIVLYLFAIMGKASVGVLPAVFWGIDLFVEKRSLKSSILDKIPFFVLTALIALFVYSAQPPSGNKFDPSVFSAVLTQSLWLLTGFGKYVIFRLRPEEASMGLKIASVLFLFVMFIAPLLLRKRFPRTTVLIYWILLGLLPAQVMSFIHPVSDRYLFFPSVAFVILIAWGMFYMAERMKKKLATVFISGILVISFLWTRATLNYLSEWKDPRSIWFAAVEKSADPHNPYCLGRYYLEMASKLGTTPRGERLSHEKAEAIGSTIWKENPKLNALLTEWQAGKNGGPAEKEFQNQLWSLGWVQFEQALHTIGTHVMPELFYQRGVLLLDRGEFPEAKKEFTKALDEASLSSVEDVKADVVVSSHNALGAIAWKQGNYREAFKWFEIAEGEQKKFGGDWIPDIAEKKRKMETTVDIMTGKLTAASQSYDPEIAYNLGLHYLDIADQLGANPSVKPFSRENCEALAKEVWPANDQLPQLLSEWDKQQHAGVAETSFQHYLKTLAWQLFEDGVRAKGGRVMPQLYFRRGMILGEQGDSPGAKKEFFAAIDEAAKDTSASIKQQYIVSAHDALGILAWRAADYTEALNWFQKAEQEQKTFGGNWVPDISSKKQRMETMINSKSAK